MMTHSAAGLPRSHLDSASDLQRRLDHAQLLYRVSAAASRAVRSREALRVGLEELCGFTGWPVGHVYEVVGERISPTGIWNLPDHDRFAAFREVTARTHFGLGEGLPGRVWASGEPAWIPDVAADENFPRAADAVDLELRAGFGVPVLLDGEVVAVLEFFTERVVEPEPLWLDTLEKVGSLLGEVVRRIRAEERLRRSEEQYRQMFERSPQPMWVFDRETYRFLAVNQAAVEHYGYSHEEFLGMTIVDIRPEEEKERLDSDPRVRRRPEGFSRMPGWRHRKKDGSVIDVEVTTHTIAYEGRSARLVQITDVTQALQARAALRENEERYRSLFEQNLDAVYVIDHQGRFVETNAACSRISGYSPDELLGMAFPPLTAEVDRETTLDRFERALAGESHNFDLTLIRKDGARVPLNATIVPMKSGGIVTGAFGIARDQTEHRRAERELRMQSEILQSVFDHVPAMIVFIDREGHFRWVNRAWEETLGWSLQEAQNGDVMTELYPDPEYRAEVLDYVRRAEPVWSDFETRTRSGDVITTSWSNVRLSDGSLVGIGIDVTAQRRSEKALRESEARFREIAENIREVFWTMNADGTETLYASPAYEEIWGRDRSELYASPGAWQQSIHPDDRERVREAFNPSTLRSGAWDHRYRIVRPDGEVRWIHDRGFPVHNEHGDMRRIVGIAEDVTHQHCAEEEIRRSLREKETLLQEVHHRVKNNLQVISSLLRIQARASQSDRIRSTLREVQQRIQSMSLLHEMMYRGDDLSEVDFTRYIRDLAQHLFHVHAVDPERIRLKVMGRQHLQLEEAIVCGLIVNELVTNSLKHAFPGERSGNVQIAVERVSAGRALLRIHDDGVGMPDLTITEDTHALGLRLVHLLAAQLGGTLQREAGAGTSMRLEFPLAPQASV